MSLRRFAFTVYDEPSPLDRARVNTKTGRFYATDRVNTARLFIRDAFLDLAGDSFEPLQGALRLTVTAWRSMPKSIPKKRQATALPSKRPDLTNYLKQVEDALLKYAYVDDGQIVTIIARKRYVGTLNDSGFVPGLSTGRITQPCWEVCLEEIEQD